MSWELGTPNTATALAAMSPESVRILWQKTVDVFEQTEDFFAQFEGSNKNSPIFVINDTEADKGLKFRVTSRAGYYGPGKSGDALFTDEDDFEQDVINSNELQADYLRNATSATKRTDEFMGMQGELVNGQAEELGKWMGREKSARIGMMFVLQGGAENLLYSGGKYSEDDLLTADGLTYNDILLMGQALKPLGGRPAEVGTVRGTPVYRYIVAGTTPSLFSLKQDDDYKQILREAGPREKYDENPLFTGGYMEVDGHIIKELNPIDPDGYAWSGSWWNAKAYLGTAITAGTTTFDITGGGSAAAAAKTRIQYFRFFPNYAFEFSPEDIYTPDTSVVRYLLVIAPRGPVTASNPTPGKIGMYSYTTGNNGNKITILNRLGPNNAGAMKSTLGEVQWNTGVWAGKHAENFPIGSTVVLCNAKGVPIGDTIMMGAMAALRGYGKYRNWRTQWDVDGQFETRKYITTVFGQKLRKNVNNKYPGYVRLRSAISYPELGLPVVTS
jgi:hypothetical protein